MTITPFENISMGNKSAESFPFEVEVTNMWTDPGTRDHLIKMSIDFVNVDNQLETKPSINSELFVNESTDYKVF